MNKLMIPTLVFWGGLGILCLLAPRLLAAPSDGETDSGRNLTLSPESEDTPAILRLKASLRLMAGFNQALYVAQACQSKGAWENYQSRNGQTFGQVFGAIKAEGGFDNKYRVLVEERARLGTRAALKVGCSAAIKDIEDGSWDIYKGIRFKADYQLFMGR